MAEVYKTDSKEITRQSLKALRIAGSDPSIEKRAKGAVALSILALLATDKTEMPLAQQLLKLLKELQR